MARQGDEAMLRALKSRRGEGYIDVCVLILCALLVLALAMNVLPVFVAKQQLNTFAIELSREAEIAGRIGAETDRRTQILRENLGIDPDISWSRDGQVQLNEEFTLILTLQADIGFGNFGSFPITLRSEAYGRSQVFWK